MPGKPLPALTLFVIWAHIPLLLLAILLPIVALVLLFVVRSHKVALILATVVMVAVFVQMYGTSESLSSPLTDIFTEMSDGAGAEH